MSETGGELVFNEREVGNGLMIETRTLQYSVKRRLRIRSKVPCLSGDEKMCIGT